MALSNDKESVSIKRSIKRRRSELSPNGNFITDEEEMNTDVFVHHDNTEVKENDIDIAVFLADDDGYDDDHDKQIQIRRNQFKIDRLIER